MQTKTNLKNRPKRKNKKKILMFVSAFIVVLIVLVVFLVPAFVSSEKGRNFILARINNSLDGKTDFAGLSMSWWKGVKITKLSFDDSRGQTSVAVKEIATKPHYGSILFGSVSLGKTTLDEPRVEINLKARQPNETKQLEQKTRAGKKSTPIALPIRKVDLVVNDGNLKVTDPKAQTVELSQIDSRVNLRPPGQETTFTLHTIVASAGKDSEIQADGRIIPGKAKGWTLKGTSGNVSVQVTDLDLPSLAPFLALAGVEIQAEGILSGSISSEVKDGQFENISADIKGKDLDITGALLKGDRRMQN